MLPLIFGIALAILIPSLILYYKWRNAPDGVLISINAVCILVMCITAIVMIVGAITLVGQPALEQQMVLCRNRCDEVTAKLTELTDSYAAYEANVYSEAAKSGMKITYPEANGASLAQQQMTLYDDWQTALYRMEQKLPVYNVWRWWLYFGSPQPIGD